MADLASFLGPEDRRFCSKATFTFLRNSKTAASDVTRWQASCKCEVPPIRFHFIPRGGSNRGGWGVLVCLEAAANGLVSAQGVLMKILVRCALLNGQHWFLSKDSKELTHQ